MEKDIPEISFTFDDKPIVKRGEIWLADMKLALGSEQAGVRPVLIISNDIGNRFSGTVEVCCITSQIKTQLPTHVVLPPILPKESTVMAEQKRTIDKMRLMGSVPLCKLDYYTMCKVDDALRISLGL